MPKLTIITINFNHQQGLQRTIDSIIGQTFTDYEWIVVDGGSTDGSKQLLEQYKDRFAWWCSESDKGVYNAMNKGLAHATGEYVNFMNSGDMFSSPNILSDLFSRAYSSDIIYGIMTIKSTTGTPMGVGCLKNNIQWYDLFLDNIGHQAEFSKRYLYDLKMFDESYSLLADWDWNAYMVAVQRVSVKYVSKVVAVYEFGGMSERLKGLADKELQIIRQKYYPSLNRANIMEYKSLYSVKSCSVTKNIYSLICKLAKKFNA